VDGTFVAPRVTVIVGSGAPTAIPAMTGGFFLGIRIDPP
jgi:hypothetical protein